MLPVALKGRSDTLDGVRYWWLADDAMISMRYARNLAEGLGLVWNAGERVEGYTNLLWTLFMALVHLTPLPDSKTSLVVLLANVGIAAATVPLIAWLVRLLGGGAWATGATLAAYVIDRGYGLLSIPTRFGVSRSIRLSRAMHVATVIAMAALWRVADMPPLYLVGVAIVAVLLTYEQSLVSDDDLSQVKRAFDLNGYVGIVYFLATALSLCLR